MKKMRILSKDERKVVDIPARKIRPNKTQPRREFDESELRSLSQSIANNGLLQPLTVRKSTSLLQVKEDCEPALWRGLEKFPV